MSDNRRNLAVKIVTPGGDNPLLLSLVNRTRIIYAGAPVSDIALVARGGLAPYAYSIVVGALPTGLSLNSTTGAITGTPNTPGRYAFVAKVTDSLSGTFHSSFAIEITAALIVIAGRPPDSAVLSTYSYQFKVADLTATILSAIYSVGSGTIPAGLLLSSGGLLSGTPLAIGVYGFTAMATYAGESVNIPCTVDIAAPLTVYELVDPIILIANIPFSGQAPNIGISFGRKPYQYQWDNISSFPWLRFNKTTSTFYGTPPVSETGSQKVITGVAYDAVGNYYTGVEFRFTVASPSQPIQMQKDGTGVGNPGPRVINLVEGPNISIGATNTGGVLTYTIGASGGGAVDTIVAGTNITVDSTDPENPIVSSTGGGSKSTEGALTMQIGADPGLSAGSVPLAIQTRYFQCPANYTLTGWQIESDVSTTTSVDIWVASFPSLPTVSETITGVSPVTLTAATSGMGTVTDWMTTIARGQWIAVAITANDNATWISVQLQGMKTATSMQVTIAATSAVLSSLAVGEAMDPVTFAASGGEGPYTYAVATGALPTGTSIDSVTGVWSGTPSVGAGFDFSVKAIDIRSIVGTTESYHVTTVTAQIVPDLDTNVALHKSVSIVEGGEIIRGSLDMLVDGSTVWNEYLSITGSRATVEIDLGDVYRLDQVKVWHYWLDSRTFHDTKTEVSADGVAWYVIYDAAVSGEYAESSDGKTNDFAARPVRYIRDSTAGNELNGRYYASNSWIEIQAFRRA